MDGRGRWMDNVFIERLWRSLKYEEVYLKGYADGRVGARRDRRVGSLLQWPTPSSSAGRSNLNGRVA